MSLRTLFDNGPEKYPALTGVRAVGAAVIFFDHFPFSVHHTVVINVLSFFFVLSGFLITRIYYNDNKAQPGVYAQYFVNRFARIYPVYFLVLTLAVCLHHYAPVVLLKNYTLTQAFFHNTAEFIVGPAWSLTVEECFYFLAPFIIFIIKRRGLAISFISLSFLLGTALLVSLLPVVFLHTPVFVLSTTFFGHYAEFFVGICLALVVMKRERIEGITKIKGTLYTWVGTAGVVLLICIMEYFYLHSITYGIIFINNFLIPIPVAFFYYGLIRERTFIAGALSCRLLSVLGRTSYAFYLLHTVVINNVSLPLLQHNYINRPMCIIVTFIAAQLLALLIYMLYEQPLNKAIRKQFAGAV